MDAQTDGRTTDNGPWHKLGGLWPVELIKIIVGSSVIHDTTFQTKQERGFLAIAK